MVVVGLPPTGVHILRHTATKLIFERMNTEELSLARHDGAVRSRRLEGAVFDGSTGMWLTFGAVSMVAAASAGAFAATRR